MLGTLAAILMLVSVVLCDFYDSCNVTVPWLIDRHRHQHFDMLTDTQLEETLRCPMNIHGCRHGRGPYPVCDEQYYLTCSCAEDCTTYGDCCWDVHTTPQTKFLDFKFDCTYVNTKQPMHIYEIAHCSRNWPDTVGDTVRRDCEEDPRDKKMFYKIPLTNPWTGITYRNGFCALCNHDIENATFWDVVDYYFKPEDNTTSTAASYHSAYTVLKEPSFVENNTFRYFRPCSRLNPVDTCHRDTSPHVRWMCRTYLAPLMGSTVSSDDDPIVYKNAYCAHCNGVDLQELSCAPKERFGAVLHNNRIWTAPTPNLATILRPVRSTTSCYSSYDGYCYIAARDYDTSKSSKNSIAEVVKSYLTVICLTLSLTCLFLKLVIFFLKKGDKTFAAKCTACLSATLFATQLVFLVANSLKISSTACAAVSIIVHYGFLSTFVWTTLMAYDIWKAVLVVSTARRHRLVRYFAIGWVSPLIIILVSCILNWTTPDSVLSPHYAAGNLCFITEPWSHFTFFVIPMAMLLFADIGFYLHTIAVIKETRSEANRFDFQGREKRTLLFLFVKLALIMGTGWLLGLISVFVNSLVLDCISIVFIGTQGVYLFIGFKDYRVCWKVVPSSTSLSALFSTTKSRSSMDSELPVVNARSRGGSKSKPPAVQVTGGRLG